MGWRSQPTTAGAGSTPAGCRAENLLGQEGHGFRYAMAGLDGGRLNIAACSLGAAQAALEADAGLYGRAGKPSASPSTSSRDCSSGSLTMEIELEAARGPSFGRRRGSSDTGAADATKACAMAREAGDPRRAAAWRTSACSFMAATGTWRITGSRKVVRDLRVHQILEGTERDHAADRGASDAGGALRGGKPGYLRIFGKMKGIEAENGPMTS